MAVFICGGCNKYNVGDTVKVIRCKNQAKDNCCFVGEIICARSVTKPDKWITSIVANTGIIKRIIGHRKNLNFIFINHSPI